MRAYSDTAWNIARIYRNVLASETRDLAGHIENALSEKWDWQPIETAPKDKNILMWWRPIDNNEWAESVVIGSVASSEEGKWWNSQRAEYQNLWHITHWMPLPN